MHHAMDWGWRERTYGDGLMDASRHGAMRTSFEIHGFFERQPGGEFSLRGGKEGGCPLAATKRLLELDTVYPLHSKGAEGWEGG